MGTSVCYSLKSPSSLSIRICVLIYLPTYANNLSCLNLICKFFPPKAFFKVENLNSLLYIPGWAKIVQFSSKVISFLYQGFTNIKNFSSTTCKKNGICYLGTFDMFIYRLNDILMTSIFVNWKGSLTLKKTSLPKNKALSAILSLRKV